ncbi:DUF1479-domain-containing protein [Xylariaceae sp. FL0662B]|nr:DUF1479-domain-containing protein [Xylariaceae sp. FL0662B]
MDQSLLPANISAGEFKQLLSQYERLVESISSAKGAKSGQKTLLELDKFRYDDAVAVFQSENPKRQMKHDDVKMLVDWKLRHGKFRPTLMKLVSSNDEAFVEHTIQNAMKDYWPDPDTSKALDTITKLKGVGPATASLLLSVHDPDRVLFFSDEAFYWLCCDGQKSPIKYNAKEYQQLNAAAQTLVKRLGVSATDIEKVAYVLMREGDSQSMPVKGVQSFSSPDVKSTKAGSSKTSNKRKGDLTSIHDVSDMTTNPLSPSTSGPLPLSGRFAKIKRDLIAGNEKAVADSFYRLLGQIRKEADRIAAAGPDIIPTIDYFDIHDPSIAGPFQKALRKRGVAIIRRVVPPNVALSWKEETREYLRHNPHTQGFPSHDPQRYEMFWSPGQVRARADSRVLEAQRFAMGAWHSSNADALVSTNHPVAYADRFRIRRPGDTSLGEGPHLDGGSVERWEPDGYGRGGTYARIFQGRWEEHDPWDSSARLGVTSDLYNGAGSCSMFRMFQGWLSLSAVAPGGGSLRACPMLHLTTAYLLLRPFFAPLRPSTSCPDFLHPSNWVLRAPPDTILHGALPGYIQELSTEMHPHLRLAQTTVPIPAVAPGDYVLWHPDAVHAADAAVRNSTGRDAAVLYVPACPLSLTNALYLARQRRAFLLGRPAPDFVGSGRASERDYLGRSGVQEVADAGGEAGLRAMGLLPWDERRVRGGAGGAGATSRVERELLRQANAILFPDRFDAVGRRGAKRP